MTSDYKLFKNVQIGQGSVIEDFCIIGIKSNIRNKLKTIIGKNSLIRAGTYIYEGNKIGENFKTGNKVNIRENNKIGRNVKIGTLSIIEHHVTISDNVQIHSNVFIPEYTVIKKGVWIGPNVTITNAKYPNQKDTKLKLVGPILETNCIIGANVTILPGIKIGKNSIIGAGSVVSKNVSANQIVYGNPAKFYKKVN